MKAYVKSYEKIKEIKEQKGIFFVFASDMRRFCGKGPFEFEAKYIDDKEWFGGKSIGFSWHVSWLKPLPKDYQYLLEFE